MEEAFASGDYARCCGAQGDARTRSLAFRAAVLLSADAAIAPPADLPALAPALSLWRRAVQVAGRAPPVVPSVVRAESEWAAIEAQCLEVEGRLLGGGRPTSPAAQPGEADEAATVLAAIYALSGNVAASYRLAARSPTLEA